MNSKRRVERMGYTVDELYSQLRAEAGVDFIEVTIYWGRIPAVKEWEFLMGTKDVLHSALYYEALMTMRWH